MEWLAYVLSIKRAHECPCRHQPLTGFAIAMAPMAGYLAFADVFDGATQRGDEFGQWRIRSVGAVRTVQPLTARAKSTVFAGRQKLVVMTGIDTVAEIYVPFDQPPGVLQR